MRQTPGLRSSALRALLGFTLVVCAGHRYLATIDIADVGGQGLKITSRFVNDTPPIAHVVTFADVRTASTVQFSILCVALHLHVLTYRPYVADRTQCYFSNFYEGFNVNMNVPQVVKSHQPPLPRHRIRNTTLVFSTAKTREEADWRSYDIERQGYTVGIIQDLKTLAEIGSSGFVQRYADIFDLPWHLIERMQEYFAIWDKLRVCCGLQMSQYWRWELNQNAVSEQKYQKPHPFCSSVDIDKVERDFMNATLFGRMDKIWGARTINRPSMLDKELTGSYCSWYNDLVREKAVPFNCFNHPNSGKKCLG